MDYSIEYHTRIKDDLSRISASARKRIQKAIEQKLVTNPVLFGKPLRHSLFGFRTLRIDNYRVVYVIEKKLTVYILLVGDRKYVYQEAVKRST